MSTSPMERAGIPQPPALMSPSPPNPDEPSDLMQTSPLTHALSSPDTPSRRGGGGDDGGEKPPTKVQPLPPLSPSTTEDRVHVGPSRSPTISSARRPSLIERELTAGSSARAQTNSLSSSPSRYADSNSISQPIPTPRQMLSARANTSQLGGFYSPRFHTPGGLIAQGTPRYSDPGSGSFAVGTPRGGGNQKRRALTFQLGRIVGSGGFGVVYQAILSDGTVAAVKEMKLDTSNTRAIDREVEIMSNLPPHPHCVQYFGSRHSRHHYYIIMEYISAGSLQSLRQQMGPFRESVFQRYAFMILLGLDHLHQHGIIHRDIKGANVLLDERGSPKIVDFGCCKNLNNLNSTLGGGGTPLWMAPEVCRGNPANEKTDVWAFGCLCLEMMNDTGLPWSFPPETTIQGLAYAIACATQPPPIPESLSAEAHNFIECCLQIDPDERLSVLDLLEHPFFDMDYLQNEDDGDELMASRGASLMKSSIKHQRRREAEDADADVMNSVVLNLHVVDSSADNSESSAEDEHEVMVYGRMTDPNDAVVSSTSASKSKSPSAPQLNPYVSGGAPLNLRVDDRGFVLADADPAPAGSEAKRTDVVPALAFDTDAGFRLASVDTESDTEVDPVRKNGDWVSSMSPSLARPSSLDGRAHAEDTVHDVLSGPKSGSTVHDVDVEVEEGDDNDDDNDDQLVQRIIALARSSDDRTTKRSSGSQPQLRATPLNTQVYRHSLTSGDTTKSDGQKISVRSPGTSSSFDTEASAARSVPSAVIQRSRRCSRDSDSDSSSEPALASSKPTSDDDDDDVALGAKAATAQRPGGQATRVAREDARRHSALVEDIYRNGDLPSALPTPEPSTATYSPSSPTSVPDTLRGVAQRLKNPSWLFRSGTDRASSKSNSTTSPPPSLTATEQKQRTSQPSSTTAKPTGRIVEAPSFPPKPAGVSGKEDAPPPARPVSTKSSNIVGSTRGSTQASPTETDSEMRSGLLHVGPARGSSRNADDDGADPLADSSGMVWLTGDNGRVFKTPGTSAHRGGASKAPRVTPVHDRSASHSTSLFGGSTSGSRSATTTKDSQDAHAAARNGQEEKKRTGVMAKLMRKL